MSKSTDPVNPIQPLRNVTIFSELVERVVSADRSLPRMATFSGPSGAGKTIAATFAAHLYRAYYVQIRSLWSAKDLCAALAREVLGQGARLEKTKTGLLNQIAEELILSRRPLIIDEADYLTDKAAMIEVVRDVYEASKASIILIGEEALPRKLMQWERVHGRMLDWREALPADMEDAGHLARLYARGVAVAPDLLAHMVEQAEGSVRRICVNLDRAREVAEVAGRDALNLADWQSLGGVAFTGQPPRSVRSGGGRR